MDDLFLISSAAFTKYLAAAGVFGGKKLTSLATYFFLSSTIFVIVCFQRMEYVFAQVLKNEERGEEFRIYVFRFKRWRNPVCCF